MVDTGALDAVELMIGDLADQAGAALVGAGGNGGNGSAARVEVAEPAREVLSNLVVAATARAK
jgi:hypothetical protein